MAKRSSLQNISNALGYAGQTIGRTIKEDRLIEEKKQTELANQQRQNEIIGTLLTGQMPQTTGGFNGIPSIGSRDITPQERVGLLLGASKESVSRYNELNKIINPKKEYKTINGIVYPVDQQGNIDFNNPLNKKPKKYKNYDFSKPEGIYAINEETNQLEKVQEDNPVYRPKIIAHKFGEDEQGNQVLNTYYENGQTVSRPTGLTSKKAIDPAKFNKALDSYVPRLNQLVKLRQSYYKPDLRKIQKLSIREQVSNLAFNEEQSLYNSLPDNLQKIINQHYTTLKNKVKKEKVGLGEYENQFQDAIQAQFLKDITNSFQEGKLDSNEYRALALWSKFKFGYLPPYKAEE